jgi:transcriptional regulator
MYVPAHFDEGRVEILHEAIRRTGLVTLVTVSADGPFASHVPMLLDPAPAPFGTLRGHIARANPQWKNGVAGAQALAIFMGPDAYVSPSLYPTKKQNGKVVPTWNYVAIHASGPIRWFEDADALLRIVTGLTQREEGSRRQPWAVTDAPADYVQSLLKAIVGFEIPIARLEGKWKMSQNRPPEDRAGLVAEIATEGGPKAAEVAAIVAERGK